MIRKSGIALWGVVLVCWILSGCLSEGKKTNQEKKTGNTSVFRVKVIVDTARYRDLEQKRLFTGILEPLKKADLAPGSPGRIRTIPVEIGDRVSKGQILATMDDAGLVALTANFENLTSQYERTKRLYENNAASLVQFESLQAQYLSTKRQLEQVTDNTILRTPFSGIVTGKSAEEGELYSPGMASASGNAGLIQVTQLDPLKLDLNVDEMSVVFLHKGMSVQMKVQALRDTIINGIVLWVNPAAQSMSRTFQVRVSVPNPGLILKSGYFVETSIIIAEKKNVLAIPASAISTNRVFAVEQDSVAVARQVTTGWSAGGYVEILSGITPGALVIVSGNKVIPDSAIVVALPVSDEKN
jgi:RND family efflux transporter MFP subunit